NLSDLAAVGAGPGPAFLALSAPPTFDRRRFFRAFLQGCRSWGVQLSGGDLARAQQVTLTLTLMGDLEAGGQWLRRDGGRPGQSLWVGGALGESALGRLLLARGVRPASGGLDLPPSLALPADLHRCALEAIQRHLEPQPQLELGRWLARLPVAGAAIDLSDGLGKDLHRLCTASQVGARIERRALAATSDMARIATLLGADMEDLALGGGEDYVLLFSLPAGVSPPPRWGCRKLGTLTEDRRVLVGGEPDWEQLPAAGWDHLEHKKSAPPVGEASDHP
ncbi:MAG: hypothetical protein KDD47_09350, partial [Acidobacteria bacterium]|nr:hypothetical protein [Acidobacteriota bacterium]